MSSADLTQTARSAPSSFVSVREYLELEAGARSQPPRFSLPQRHRHGCRDVRYIELETDVLPVRPHGAHGESEILGGLTGSKPPRGFDQDFLLAGG